MAKLPKDHFCFELGRDLEEIVADANSTLLSDAAERLPIDDFIDRLASRKRKPKLDPGAVSYFALVSESPHSWMRNYLRFTFMELASFAPSRRADLIVRVQTLHSDAERLQASIRRFIEAHSGWSTLSYMHQDQPYSTIAAWTTFMASFEQDLRKALESTERCVEIVTARWDELAPIEGGRPTQRWKRFFVGSMAHAWRQLTGSAPRRNPYSLFVEFVDAAWHSGEEMPNISWEQAIRSLPECIAEYSNYHRRIEERLQKAS